MSNTNNNLQTQTSNALHNAIIEAGGKDRPLMLAPGSSETTSERYMENCKNVSQYIRNQLDAEAKAVQIILRGIDNDISFTVDAYLNAYILKQHWNKVNEIRAKRLTHTANPLALVAQQQPVYHPQNYHNHYTQNSSTRLQQATTRNREKTIVNSPSRIYDKKPDMVTEDDALSKEKEIDKLIALISLSFKKIYKPTNNNLRTSSNTSRAHQDNTLRINKGTGRMLEIETGKGCSLSQGKMLLCKQKEAGLQLNAEQADWRDDIDDEHDDQELEANYLYMEKIQEVTPDVADNSGPTFDTESLQKVQNINDNYNVLANDREHPEQLESVNDTFLEDMSTNEEMVDQDDLPRERNLLASLIDKLKCEIDDRKNHNKILESSNKTLIDKLKDRKKFQAELDRYHDVNYASKMEIHCAKAKADLMSYKMESQKSLNEHT
nr:hypothetical protein [Tanacetum cinerariifolium]